jgi:rhamnulokinase
MAPGDMPGRIAAALTEQGDAVPTTQAAMARCMLESLAVAFAEAVRDASLLADRSGMPVLAGPVEATALGNVLVQARSLALGGTLKQVRALVAEVYPPQRFEPRG